MYKNKRIYAHENAFICLSFECIAETLTSAGYGFLWIEMTLKRYIEGLLCIEDFLDELDDIYVQYMRIVCALYAFE
ncbi:uncharacterized protein T551_00572 [Pneumocystis jirovecii RU7]|uniref:Uncharacterized protein n=1 Tax=Pneumocystis jirovecii (strain RU7) TaxID=1408657 RepID=A0A0W4ZVU2_PNEJ7|nr:uncharacterized protein T551_00572 [Pneumocystis jirovecii RU7]KTW32482.1 hypothetical protein T551_00572 [Pneumocystis jirovecii RU7]